MENNPLSILAQGIPLNPLPAKFKRDLSIPHAPKRNLNLSKEDFKLAIINALRYFPSKYHAILGPEFVEELNVYGHIYMYRFIPTQYEMKAYNINLYPSKCKHAACIMLMIMNNLDKRVAQFPHELITYGGNGSVFNHWGQYHLTMQYLSKLTEEQTLVMMSGHPAGLFPSKKEAPRVVISNGMVIPNYSSKNDYDRLYALGTSLYGQMTAGSYCYIGPQGIVHGTTLTVLNAARKYLGLDSLSGTGVVYLSSGLGGMSGAQAKATVICGAIGVIAEVDRRAIDKRHKQGWVKEVIDDMDQLIKRIKQVKRSKEITSIAYHGNIVEIWERLVKENELLVELASDQTSLHNPFNGGYYPVQLSFEDSQQMMSQDPNKFKLLVQESLRRQIKAINQCTKKGLKFWDYGNCFLLEASRAGADVLNPQDSTKFRYQSYIQDLLGDAFSLGFGPYRWICTSGEYSDLKKSDEIAANELKKLAKIEPKRIQDQLNDNIFWITNADKNKLVVGSQARICYAHAKARINIAIEFNKAIKEGKIIGPIVLSRDHHDVSGTDSPFRETSNVYDGSNYCADMAVHNFVGDSFRGATWIALHNGGGVGWGEVINGGFGLVLDGTKEAEQRAKDMLFWDVNNGINRRAWAGNDNANFQIRRAMEDDSRLQVTLANFADKDLIEKICHKESKL